jgi:anti-sigma factor RsiW
MTTELGISKEELHAFIDGELDPVRTAEIEKLAAANADLAERIARFRSDKKRLGEIYGALRELSLPPKWLQLAEDPVVRQLPPSSSRRFSRRDIAAMAAGVLMIVGIGLAYEGLVVPGEDTIIAEALAARQNNVLPEQSFPAIASAPDRGNQLLTAALMMSLKAPDLTRLGYRLADIGIYSGVPGGKAVELSYRNAENRLFTLYLRHPSSPARVDLIQRDGMRICIWQDDVLGTVMLGEMSAGEMARIASLAYSGLTAG